MGHRSVIVWTLFANSQQRSNNLFLTRLRNRRLSSSGTFCLVFDIQQQKFIFWVNKVWRIEWARKTGVINKYFKDWVIFNIMTPPQKKNHSFNQFYKSNTKLPRIVRQVINPWKLKVPQNYIIPNYATLGLIFPAPLPISQLADLVWRKSKKKNNIFKCNYVITSVKSTIHIVKK